MTRCRGLLQIFTALPIVVFYGLALPVSAAGQESVSFVCRTDDMVGFERTYAGEFTPLDHQTQFSITYHAAELRVESGDSLFSLPSLTSDVFLDVMLRQNTAGEFAYVRRGTIPEGPLVTSISEFGLDLLDDLRAIPGGPTPQGIYHGVYDSFHLFPEAPFSNEAWFRWLHSPPGSRDAFLLKGRCLPAAR